MIFLLFKVIKIPLIIGFMNWKMKLILLLLDLIIGSDITMVSMYYFKIEKKLVKDIFHRYIMQRILDQTIHQRLFLLIIIITGDSIMFMAQKIDSRRKHKSFNNSFLIYFQIKYIFELKCTNTEESMAYYWLLLGCLLRTF